MDATWWLNWGVLGGVLLLILSGQLVPGVYHKLLVDSLRTQLKEKNEENKDLRSAVTQTTPLLEKCLVILTGLHGRQ